MEQTALLKIFLPEWLFEFFELVSVDVSADRIDFYLDELKVIPSNLCTDEFVSHGFTPYTTFQDFPIKGKAVYLHVRRRKWLHTSTGKIQSSTYEFTHKGTQLAKEFVSFLKATN